MARPMVRSTAGVSILARAQLAVVPRRRRTARLITVAAFVASMLMLGAAAFQTQLARRQVDIDRVDRQIRIVKADFNNLRAQRAELRSPARLAASGSVLGMGMATKTDFITIDPEVVAAVQQSAGGVFDPGTGSQDPVFDEFKIDRKSTRLNSSHMSISYAVFCLKKKTITKEQALAAPTDLAGPLAAAADELLTEALSATGWRSIRLLGVRVSALGPLVRQLDLFSATPLRDARLSAALHKLEERFGPRVIRRAATLDAGQDDRGR